MNQIESLYRRPTAHTRPLRDDHDYVQYLN